MGTSSGPPLDAQVAIAKQAWDKLASHIPVEQLRSPVVPREVLLPHERLLYKLYVATEHVESVLADQVAAADDPILQLNPSHAMFVRSSLLPNARYIKRAWLLCDELGELLFRELDPPESEERRPGRKFEKALAFVAEYADKFDEDDLRSMYIDDTYKLLNSQWFQPDAWFHNMAALRPLILGIDPGKIPLRIKFRLREVHRAFIFESWMAAMALCRSLVEFVLADAAPRLGFRATHPSVAGVERYLTLDQLIQETVRLHPLLHDDLRLLQDSGNRILHPRRKQNVIPTPKILRSEALTSLRSATHIIEYAYSADAANDS